MRQDISEIRKVNDIQFNISLARLLIKLIKKFAFCFILLVTCKFVSLEKKRAHYSVMLRILMVLEIIYLLLSN